MESHLFGVLCVRPRGTQTGAAIWHQFWYRGLAPQRWKFHSLVLHILHRRAEVQPPRIVHSRGASGTPDRFCTHAYPWFKWHRRAGQAAALCSFCLQTFTSRRRGGGPNLAEAQPRPVSQPFLPRLHVRNCMRLLRSRGNAKTRLQRQLCVTQASPSNSVPQGGPRFRSTFEYTSPVEDAHHESKH